MFFKTIKDIGQRCKLWITGEPPKGKMPIKAWIGHEGSPKKKCCLIGAPSQDEALRLLQGSDQYDSEFAVVERIANADVLFDDQNRSILDPESDDKALYYYLTS